MQYRFNREAEIARHRKYREENLKKVRESERSYREKNRVHRQARARFLGKSPERRLKSNIKGHKRRIKKLAKIHDKYTLEQLQERYSPWECACAYCGITEKVTIDHVIPIAHPKGCDVLSNIVPACRKCNCYSKRDEALIPWYRKQPFFDSERLLVVLFSLGEEELKVVLRDALDARSSAN